MNPKKFTPEFFNSLSAEYFPAHLGIMATFIKPGEVGAEFEVTKSLLAPNGYLHAGAVVTLADTCAGYGCVSNLPESATGFTTIELKSNHIGTVREGIVECTAKAVHLGGTTQVWDAVVTSQASGKTIALFRCTQMVLYAK
ncbi:MAG: competence protein ComA [Alteromonadaceae bacterium]|nr:MAG: competence protein ComA [Alteromonadaceae bacterium]